MSKRAANRARMEELVGRWEGSGQSVSVFSRRHGISRHKLIYWKRQLVGSAGAEQAVELAPVQLIGSAAADEGRLEIVLGTGDRVLVPESIPVERLRDVVSVLRGC